MNFDLEIFKKKLSEEELKLKGEYIMPFTVSLVFFATLFGIYYLSLNANYSGTTFILSGCCAWFIPVLKRTFNNHYITTNYILTITLLALTGTAFLNGGITAPSVWYMPTIPMFAAFLINGKAVLWWTGITSVGYSFLMLADKYNWMAINEIELTSTPALYFLSIVGLTTLVAEISLLTEYIREKSVNENENLKNQAQRNSSLAALGEMAGGIAHEINNPLMIINGSVMVINKMIKKDDINKEKIEKHLATIEKTVQRAATIIKGLKTLSRDGTDDIREKLTLHEVMEEVLSFLEGKLKHSQVKLNYNSNDENLKKELYVQRVQLSQVFLNLIGNAFDAISENQDKWITIQTQLESDFLLVKIIDCGNGISPEMVEKIFNPFFTTKDVGKGTGLGLSLCHTIMEKNMGTIFVDHNNPHTCFVVKVPLYDEQDLKLIQAA